MLNRKEMRTVGLTALGAMFEFYDFVIFLFVAASISEAFFPPGISPWLSQIQTFAIFAVGYLVRPIAGIVLSHFGDMIGRKKMFIFLLFLMAVPTFLIGVLPTYEQVGVLAPVALVVLRVLQGCAVGGEYPSAAVFVSEHASQSKLGVSGGILHGVVGVGLLLGTGAAALSALIAVKTGHASLAWRLPFVLGGMFGMTAAYLRRHLQESPLYAEIKQSRHLAKDIPVKVVVREHAGACLFGLGLSFVMSCGATVFFQYLPTLLVTEYGINKQDALHANMWGTLAYAASMPVWGRICDTLGWSRTLCIGAIAILAADVCFFYLLPGVVTEQGTLGLLFALPGIAVASVTAMTPGLLSSLFPTNVRQSGYALPYNLGSALFAGLAPLTLAWLVREFGPGVPLYPVIVAALVTACLALKVRGMRLYLGSGQPEMEPVVSRGKAGSA